MEKEALDLPQVFRDCGPTSAIDKAIQLTRTFATTFTNKVSDMLLEKVKYGRQHDRTVGRNVAMNIVVVSETTHQGSFKASIECTVRAKCWADISQEMAILVSLSSKDVFHRVDEYHLVISWALCQLGARTSWLPDEGVGTVVLT